MSETHHSVILTEEEVFGHSLSSLERQGFTSDTKRPLVIEATMDATGAIYLSTNGTVMRRIAADTDKFRNFMDALARDAYLAKANHNEAA